jgi:uncharacterized membrane protein YtjA (UPF0391 family)
LFDAVQRDAVGAGVDWRCWSVFDTRPASVIAQGLLRRTGARWAAQIVERAIGRSFRAANFAAFRLSHHHERNLSAAVRNIRSNIDGKMIVDSIRPDGSRIDPLKERVMLSYALWFLVIAIVAGALGFSGIAGTASWIAQVLFVLFLVLFVISFFTRRKVI